MATSVRLSPALQRRLAQAAAAAGTSTSQIIREGIAKRCDEILGQHSARERLADVIGIVRSDTGGLAQRSSEAFLAGLLEQQQQGRL